MSGEMVPPPGEFRKQLVEETAEKAVGALRRPHEGTVSAEAIESSPKPPAAVARSARLDASTTADQS
jgi:hypothetical protein